MGGVCGGLGGAPEIDVDAAQIAEEVASATEELVNSVPKIQDDLKTKVNACNADEKVEVPDTNITLTKDSTDDEIRNAAITSAFATKGRDNVKNTVWGVFEPTIDEQLADVPLEKAKQMAKDKFKEATIDPAVDKALDEALAKMKSE